MAYTVTAAFNQFFEAINLSGDHRTTATNRKDHLVGLLSKHFQVMDSFASGSIPKITALSEHADLDIIVALHYGKHIKDKTPAQVLQSVRDALGQSKNNVRKNGQAVTLYYTTWPNVDIVPVKQYVDNNNVVTYYGVPDMNSGQWIDSNPKAHAANIDAKATECGADFRRIIKMIKWWNRCHSNYLQSYHIEVLAYRVLVGLLGDITWSVYKFFDDAIPLLRSSLWYDRGYADAYLSISDRNEVIKRFETARDKAQTAWYLTYGDKSDHAGAIGCWRQIFGDKFPSYG